MDEAKRQRRIERFEQLGEETVRADMNAGGCRVVGGSPEVRQLARDWLAEKECERQKADADPWILEPKFGGFGIKLKKLWPAMRRWKKRE